MLQWDSTTWIAVLALVVSGLSFVVAIWATWISQRTLAHARETYEQERVETFERERSELLEIINTSRGILDKARIEIGTQKAIFDAEPQPVRTLLASYASLFTEYLPKIEGGVHQAGALWDEVAEWESSRGTRALIQQQARFRALLHEDEMVRQHGIYMLNEFKDRLEKARNHVSGAVR